MSKSFWPPSAKIHQRFGLHHCSALETNDLCLVGKKANSLPPPDDRKCPRWPKPPFRPVFRQATCPQPTSWKFSSQIDQDSEKMLAGWWFQPSWKILAKMGIFPNRDENSKCSKPPASWYLLIYPPRNSLFGTWKLIIGISFLGLPIF